MKSQNQIKPSITLSNPLLVSETFSNNVIYTIKTLDSTGNYEFTRDYNEFISIRKILAKKWPGIYIPPLPNRSILSNIYLKFVKTYKKQTQYFLEYLSCYEFLYTTEELQCFLKSKDQFNKNFKLNYNEISLNYQAIFYEYSRSLLVDELRQQLQVQERFFEKNLEPIVTFRDKAEELVLDFKDYHNLLANSSNQLLKTENSYILDKEPSRIFEPFNLPNVKNHYNEMFAWAEMEVMELESILESISVVYKLDEMHQKVLLSLESYAKELEKAEQNKTSIKGFFSFKSKNKYVEDIRESMGTKEDEARNLNNLRNIIISRLINIEIPNFKQTRVSAFSNTRLQYNHILSQSLGSLCGFAKSTIKNLRSI
jgi:sorting nexin-1/2